MIDIGSGRRNLSFEGKKNANAPGSALFTDALHFPGHSDSLTGQWPVLRGDGTPHREKCVGQSPALHWAEKKAAIPLGYHCFNKHL